MLCYSVFLRKKSISVIINTLKSDPDPARYDLVPRGTVPRRIGLCAVQYCAGMVSVWYCTAPDLQQFSNIVSPRYRTAPIRSLRGTVLRRNGLCAVLYRAETFKTDLALRKMSKNFFSSFKQVSGVHVEQIKQKKRRQKISCYCPFKRTADGGRI